MNFGLEMVAAAISKETGLTGKELQIVTYLFFYLIAELTDDKQASVYFHRRMHETHAEEKTQVVH